MFQHCHNLKKTVTHDSSVSLHLVPQRTHNSVCSLWHFSVPLHASYRGVKWVGQMSGFYNLYLVSKMVTHLTITCCGFICTPGICRVWMQPLEQLEECGLIKITTEVARMRVWDLNPRTNGHSTALPFTESLKVRLSGRAAPLEIGEIKAARRKTFIVCDYSSPCG